MKNSIKSTTYTGPGAMDNVLLYKKHNKNSELVVRVAKKLQ